MSNSRHEVTRWHRIVGELALLGVVLALILNIGFYAWARPGGILRDLSAVADVRQALMLGYVDEPDQEALNEAAIRGMVDSLGDPHTTFFNREQLTLFTEDMEGEYTGIGAEIDLQEDRLRIVQPFEDSPAWQAGVLPGDIVLSIDGFDTRGISIEESQRRLKGEPGTQVRLRVRHRDGVLATLDITRAVIQVATVRGAHRLDDGSQDYMLDDEQGIAYIQLTQFREKSTQELVAVLDQLRRQGMEALILDLRNNGGGLLSSAHEICDLFLTGGQTVVTVRGRATAEEVLRSTDKTLYPDQPLVVLVNEQSASASEIVAGALQDNGRALIVGTRTYGKGSVQQVMPLGDGIGALKLTTARWYVPSGRLIHRVPDAEQWGVDPSPGAYVGMTVDEQLEMIRRRRDVLTDDPFDALEGSPTPAWIEAELLDKQLAGALTAARGRLADGDWPDLGGGAAGEMVAQAERVTLERQRDELAQALAEVERRLGEVAPDPVVDDATDGPLPEVPEQPADEQPQETPAQEGVLQESP